MTDREKMVSLINESRACFYCYPLGDLGEKQVEKIADYLLANGVRLESNQATSDESNRWIPVTESLPEESGEYLAYCGEYDGICVIYYEILKTRSKWRTNWKQVTHWMPLPTPPKED